ncbi:MAG: hypothetical protein ABW360_18840 [Phenylobacterium sp.]
MAFLRNDAVNRVNLHSAVQALAQAGGGVFFLAYLLRAGVPVPTALLAQAAIVAGRFALRPLVLPLARRFGLKPLVIAGTLILALQYPLLARVDGVGPGLLALCVTTALGELTYWLSYNAYFASLGDAEHRGHQVSAREALVATSGIIAPVLGAWALLTFGPGPMFAAVGVVQALAAIPLLGVPNVAVKPAAPGLLRAAKVGALLAAADGWLDAWFILIWQIALFVTLRQDIAAYGGAMALAALVGAACGLLLGRHVDAGHGRRAVTIAYGAMAIVVLLRGGSAGLPWLAVSAHALGGFSLALLSPVLSTANYNLAKASPCPLRFHMATEAAWDVGCFSACLLGAALAAGGVPLAAMTLLGLPALAATVRLLRRYYATPS